MFEAMKRWGLLFFFTGLALLHFHTGMAQVHTDTLSSKEAEKLQKKFDRELRKADKVSSFKVLPILYYTPETNLAFGLGGMYSFKFNKADTLLKFSKISPSLIYTLNKQMLLAANYELNFDRKRFARGSLGYFIYPYFFAGLGNDHNSDSLEWYGAKFPMFELDLYQEVLFKNFYFGLKYRFQNTVIDSVLAGGLLENSSISGASGSIQSALGFGLIYDSRDNQWSATKGWYAELGTMWADNWLGASYSDQMILADLRKYIPVSKKNDIIALQVYGEFHTGNVPFNLMPLLGGRYRMRGYREGVYRDRQMMVYQAEFRSRLFFKYFGFAAFGSVGAIGENMYTVNRNYRYTYGVGLRISPLPKERYFIRLDYGRGENTQGFYIEIGEAF